MIRLKIDVTKIEKDRLFKGEKGTYLDVVLIETPDSKYGDDFVAKQDITKEERGLGVQAPIIGNARWLKKPDERNVSQTAAEPVEEEPLPF